VNNCKGFTLVEILLAITLLSMLLALAYGGLHASTRATERGQIILEESSRVRMAHQFVRKQLNQAIPMAFNQTEESLVGAEDAEVFLGSSQSIRYVGPMPGYLGFGGPQVQQLSIVQGEEGMALILEHALVQGFEESLLNERAPIQLVDHLASAEFQFQGRDEEGELMPWTNVWEDTAVLPVAISLDIEFEEGSFTQWPWLVAPVKIDASILDGMPQGTTYKSAIQQLIDRRQKRN